MPPRIAWVVIMVAFAQHQAFANQPIVLDIAANSIGYNVQTEMLYATIPSSAGLPYGNCLVEFSPSDGLITNSVFVGSEPGPLAISSDAPVAYVGLEGAAAVRQIALAPLSAGLQFVIGSSTPYGPLFPSQIAVMPGATGTIAVSRRNYGTSPDYQGVAIFDNGIMRPTAVKSFYGPVALAFGSQAATLYGYDGINQWAAYKLSVEASGVSVTSSYPYLINGFGVNIVADNDLIYSTSGQVVDGTQMQLLGSYDSSGPVVVDDARQTVSFIHGNQIQVFDRDTFVPVYSVAISAARGNPVSATGCGVGCIGTAFDSGQIFVFQDIRTIFADGFE